MYSLLAYLLQPYVLLLLLIGVALAALWRRRQETSRRLLVLGVLYLLLVLLSVPAVAYFVVGSLEWQQPAAVDADTDIIVVLGGGVLPADAGRPHAELDASSAFRCLHAAELYHRRKPCRVLISGGNPQPDPSVPPCADLMAELLRKLGVKESDLLVENTSRTTYENAVESRKLLEKLPPRKLLLVTEGIHLHRAVLCFRKQGIAVEPSGCRYQATEFKPSVSLFLPDLGGIAACQEASHEWLGIIWYWLCRRI
jgi:uncharacterized SAM-binding protein YcdF (DUF218 family)